MHYYFKKYYFISKFDTKILSNQDKDTVVIYRNYKQNKHDEIQLIKIRNYCKKRGIKFLLSNNFKLAIKLNLDGAYIPSFNNQTKHLSYSTNKKFMTIGSAHNLKEIRMKELQKVSIIVISSLFKKNDNFLGIYRYKILKKLSKIKVIPLGGISSSNIKLLKLLKANVFAGISFFEKKKAPKI